MARKLTTKVTEVVETKQDELFVRTAVPDSLEELASLYRERGSVYGDNYLHAGEVLLGLFPRGLSLNTAEDFNRLHLIVHMTSKLSRYCANVERTGKGHEDSLRDLAVYAMMTREADEIATATEKSG